MPALSFRVRSWSAWTPGRETAADWFAWAGQPGAASDLPLEPTPVLLRRRVSPLGQKALKAAWSLPDSAGARLVFASRHGEFGRTVSILEALAAGKTVSPADFTLSVHNALSGLLSIARGNQRGHTMVAGGCDSFALGMVEALASLAEQPETPVVFVYFDEPLPPPFDVFDPDPPAPIAVALTLTAAEGEHFTLATSPVSSHATPEPVAHAFMRFILGAEPSAVIMGERLTCRWERGDAPA